MLLILLGMFSLASQAKSPVRVKKHRAPAIETSTLPNGHLQLSWRPSGDSLCLERRLPDQDLFSALKVLSPLQGSFEDSSLAPGVPVTFRLRPVQSRYLEEFGPEITVQLSLSPLPRFALSRLAADSITVTLVPSEPCRMPIVVERKMGGVFSPIGRIAPGDLTFYDGPLRTGVQQAYRLRYERDFSGLFPSVPDSILLDLLPSANISLIYLNDHTIELSWPRDSRFASRIEIEKQTSDKTQLISVSATAASWIDSALGYAVRTNYRLRAVTQTDSGEFSPAVSAFYRLNPLQQFTADPVRDLNVHLNWVAADSLTAGFVVERSDDSTHFVDLARLGGETYSYVDSLRERGVTRYYRITSVASNGSTMSSEVISQRIPLLEEGMVFVRADSGRPDFFCDAFEISVSQFQGYCRAIGRELPPDPGFPDHPDYWNLSLYMPAVNVSWNDAAAFCNWRSQSVGLQAAYDSSGALLAGSNGYRLLDRSHFARTLSAATDSTEVIVGAGGTAVEPVAADTQPVKLHATVRHLLGNVWEWASDVTSDSCHVILGGAYSTPRKMFSGTPEFCYRADYTSPTIGFRCMLEEH